MKTKRSKLIITSFLILATLVSFVQMNTRAQGLLVGSPAPRFVNSVCYLIADGDDGKDEDTISWLDWDSKTQTIIGKTNTYNVEAVAFEDDTQTLYGMDQDRLGTFDLTTGLFTAKPEPVGSGYGDSGLQYFSDIDGLAFDDEGGKQILYATVRRSGAVDLLIKINPETGVSDPNAFGINVAYVKIQPIDGVNDVDDIAINPITHEMWGVANVDFISARLAKIDKQTGQTTYIGPVGIENMEGMSFDPVGQLLGTTGKDSRTVINGINQSNHLFRIDMETGAADLSTSQSLAIKGTFDYEAVDCLNVPAGTTPTPTLTLTATGNPPDVTDTPSPTPTQPTAIRTLNFWIGKVAGDKVMLAWTTKWESNNAAFELYRSSDPNPANARFMASIKATNRPGGDTYYFTDTVSGQGHWWYWLADVDTSGRRTFHYENSVSFHKILVPFLLMNR